MCERVSKRGRRSNKSLEIALAPTIANGDLGIKIALATKCFTTIKYCELVLRSSRIAR